MPTETNPIKRGKTNLPLLFCFGSNYASLILLLIYALPWLPARICYCEKIYKQFQYNFFTDAGSFQKYRFTAVSLAKARIAM